MLLFLKKLYWYFCIAGCVLQQMAKFKKRMDEPSQSNSYFHKYQNHKGLDRDGRKVSDLSLSMYLSMFLSQTVKQIKGRTIVFLNECY